MPETPTGQRTLLHQPGLQRVIILKYRPGLQQKDHVACLPQIRRRQLDHIDKRLEIMVMEQRITYEQTPGSIRICNQNVLNVQHDIHVHAT